MIKYGDFAVGKCGNANAYFLIDADMADRICGNVWTMDSRGYPCRKVGGVLQRMHTFVVEEHMGGRLDKGMYIDHINKCKTDNRICNLRVVSPRDSAKNMPLKSNNTTGVTGVSQGRGGKGYRAYITVSKRRIDLGTYPTLHEAARARYVAEEKYGFTHQQNLAAFLIALEDEQNGLDSHPGIN